MGSGNRLQHFIRNTHDFEDKHHSLNVTRTPRNNNIKCLKLRFEMCSYGWTGLNTMLEQGIKLHSRQVSHTSLLLLNWDTLKGFHYRFDGRCASHLLWCSWFSGEKNSSFFWCSQMNHWQFGFLQTVFLVWWRAPHSRCSSVCCHIKCNAVSYADTQNKVLLILEFCRHDAKNRYSWSVIPSNSIETKTN